jgi:hypothetical protein
MRLMLILMVKFWRSTWLVVALSKSGLPKTVYFSVPITSLGEYLFSSPSGLPNTLMICAKSATGFQYERDKEALQEIVSRYIRKELAAWVKRFPDEFYKEIYRLKGWQWQGMSKNRYSIVGKYTIDLVYERLAPRLLEELQKKSPKDEKGRRKNKLQEWLSEDVGVPALSQHLFALITLAKVNTGWNRFVEMVDRALPKRGATLLLPFPEPDEE